MELVRCGAFSLELCHLEQIFHQSSTFQRVSYCCSRLPIPHPTSATFHSYDQISPSYQLQILPLCAPICCHLHIVGSQPPSYSLRSRSVSSNHENPPPSSGRWHLLPYSTLRLFVLKEASRPLPHSTVLTLVSYHPKNWTLPSDLLNQ